MYHHYTVDEHLLRTVGAISAIEAGRLKADHPLASEFIHKISHRTELYLAAFLHDKGNEGVSGLVKQTANSIGYVELVYAVQNKFHMERFRTRPVPLSRLIWPM